MPRWEDSMTQLPLPRSLQILLSQKAICNSRTQTVNCCNSIALAKPIMRNLDKPVAKVPSNDSAPTSKSKDSGLTLSNCSILIRYTRNQAQKIGYLQWHRVLGKGSERADGPL